MRPAKGARRGAATREVWAALLFFAAGAVVGCAPSHAVASDHAAEADTGSETDTGDATTGGAITVTITQGGAPSADFGGLAIELFWNDEPYAGSPLTGDVTVFDPPAPALALLDESADYPGLYFGDWFVAAVVEDSNGDGAWNAGEAFVGMPLSAEFISQYLEYVGGTLSPEAVEDGWGLGWYVMYYETGPCCDFGPPDIATSLNLLAIDIPEVGGTAALADPADVRIELVNTLPELQGAPAMVDVPYSETWALSLPFVPPAESVMADSALDGVTHSVGTVVAYRDVDGSGSETAGDQRLGMLCDGGYAIGVEWVEAPDDLPEATYLSRFGFRTGWQLGVLQSGRLEPLGFVSDDPPLDPTDLSLSASCGAE